MKMFYSHPYHLVSSSPWPMLISLSIMSGMMGAIFMFSHNYYYLLIKGGGCVVLCMIQWWRDVIRESTFQGLHTNLVMKSLKLGMFLFIISELFFFISFFWAYFHSALSPNVELGVNWPPKNIVGFNPYLVPMLNTVILLSSGGSITWAHQAIMLNEKKKGCIGVLVTIILGIIFSLIQAVEYGEAMFCISDSVYGSLFFMTTGFHGLHVIIGSSFLMVIYCRLLMNHFSKVHHFGFEASAWYWHFVDVIWIIVYTMIYWWN
uniref:Cytochrome c oxidase subunit 3 n=1 Tax=Pujadella villari TaxID=2943468 RepID=A0A9E8G728_9HYME|nr:cytochrome c oxidase subunit 3 [Pujadella villari]